VDVGNSGTSLRIGVSVAALAPGTTEFTGDEQIRRRPLQPLLDALNSLGAEAVSVHNNGMAPVKVKGPMNGGHTSVDAFTSQFLTSLLMSCPLAAEDTEITVVNLNERPYIDMTIWWLRKQNIGITHDPDYTCFAIPGNQSYSPFDMEIPADFSSATFFIVLAAVSGGKIVFENLDLSDPQGDKKVLDVVEEMGALVVEEKGTVCVQGGELKGIEVDMNDIPDALPALAVAGCFAEGETRLVNAPQARVKETDRIRVMHEELSRMGADIEELEDGLIIRKSDLKGTSVHGHDDHRIVMALTVAGVNAEGATHVDTAEAVDITFPGFAECMKECGGRISVDP
jgi:3-phosphoshikimate 1-carboxyvinyltransferase